MLSTLFCSCDSFGSHETSHHRPANASFLLTSLPRWAKLSPRRPGRWRTTAHGPTHCYQSRTTGHPKQGKVHGWWDHKTWGPARPHESIGPAGLLTTQMPGPWKIKASAQRGNKRSKNISWIDVLSTEMQHRHRPWETLFIWGYSKCLSSLGGLI